MKRTHGNENLWTRGAAGLLLAGWLSLASGADAGKIVLAVGDARMDGQTVKEGVAVKEGAELTTGADGYLYLKTMDNGFLILRPGSAATVDAYRVDHEDPKKSRFKFSLRQGVARNISGEAVGKAKENFRFNTPVAAIGVRGTDFSLYADAEETRLVVFTGGVIVSGYGAACPPGGDGPCEGAGSKEFFAGTPDVLQIQKEENVPRIVKDKELSPDFVTPPRPDEPAVSNTSGRKSASLPPLEPSPADQDSADLDPLKQSQLQPVIWGRWQSISDDLPATVDLGEMENNKGHYVTISNDYYLIWRNKENAVLTPSSGGLSFTLADSLAHVESASGQVAAQVSDGRLSFDFDRALFTTELKLNTQGQDHHLYANGSVSSNGLFQSRPLLPGNMEVQGFLSETPQETSASYLFQSTLAEGVKASGVTLWDKSGAR
jgi:hypothetical protein